MIQANEIEYWASLGNLAEVEKAVELGHDVNVVGQGGYTALHAAAENNHMDVLKYLVAKGAKIDARLETGETPLELARLSGNAEAEKYLRELSESD